MAWVEKRGDRRRIAFRYRGEKFNVKLGAVSAKEADACRVRLEENLRLVERGRLPVPVDVDFGLFLLSDGRLDRPVEVERSPRLKEVFAAYQSRFTQGAKENITRRVEDIHMRHLTRILGADTPLSTISGASLQEFVDARSKEKHRGNPIKPITVRKAVATFRFVWNWANAQKLTAKPYPKAELVFPRAKQAERFRTYDEIQAILTRGALDPKRVRELWEGLFLDPRQVNDVLDIIKRRTRSSWLHPFALVAAHTGARRSELFRSLVEDFDFNSKLLYLREKKRKKDQETFRTVEMTPTVEAVMQVYLRSSHPGGRFAFCSEADRAVTDKQAWKAFRTAVKGSSWEVMKGFHVFRHSFASNLAAAGIDQRVIDELMGHTTVEMQRRYRHLFPDQRRAAVFRVYEGGTGEATQQ